MRFLFKIYDIWQTNFDIKMSVFLIEQYHNEVEKIIHNSGSKKETVIRSAFYTLLNEYAKQKGLMLITEVTINISKGKRITPDGTIKDSLRQDWGYWESKDTSDKIDDEIQKKFDLGYPKENILFEDSQTAILIQNGIEVMRVSFKDSDALHRLLTQFISFERPEVTNFRKAIEHFKEDIPKVTEVLRGIIIAAENTNNKFKSASKEFLKICKNSINKNITNEDVREMIIQHILTEDIFNSIFDENQFHRENNIAKELEKVINSFFTGVLRKTALGTIKHYYQTINAAAAGIVDHHEKQKFLKVVYETFYKSYNPKAADRLGVVYTPNEIVRFMIESTDYLLNKHFNKFLHDKNVEIMDPATGTGTFICDLIDYIRKEKLEHKYKNEIHANEVAILPYYISNLNIEYTYAQKMGSYSEFENLCFVDTLDNVGFSFKGKQTDLFGSLSEENSLRIKKQNEKKIAVIIGNPPYNGGQKNENDDNKNRSYPHIDKRMKETFIKFSNAQKTKLYDPYVRFYRWAFDRIDENGVISFITNRSFIDTPAFDGFRYIIQKEFSYAYIIDTHSDVRKNSKIAGTSHNVFGIQTGIAILFLIKKNTGKTKQDCVISYFTLDDFWKKEQKLQWFSENKLKEIAFEIIRPDKRNNWIELSDENDWEELLPMGDKGVKKGNGGYALFDKYSTGVSTNRDEYITDFSKEHLVIKMKYFVNTYNSFKLLGNYGTTIKWSRNLKRRFESGKKELFDKNLIIKFNYRPYSPKYLYNSELFIDEHGLSKNIFNGVNKGISISGNGSSKQFQTLGIDNYLSLDYLEKTQFFPMYLYNKNGGCVENITNWGLKQFTSHYNNIAITKEDIFQYVYAVLHNPTYRTKYEINLKRDYPRIPFYENFEQWRAWGETLLDLHINYETVKKFKLKTETIGSKENPKAKLKANKELGSITIDENTALSGIPASAWDYKLGNRSALEWVLDQYKEKKPSDPIIAEKFNTYKFADFKDFVIDLLHRVTTVSVETMSIVNEMKEIEL